MSATSDQFPSETAGLPQARLTELVELADGDQFDLRIGPVTKRLGDATVRMLAYNDSIPGPTLKVKEGSEVVVNVENQGDLEATVHENASGTLEAVYGTDSPARTARAHDA